MKAVTGGGSKKTHKKKTEKPGANSIGKSEERHVSIAGEGKDGELETMHEGEGETLLEKDAEKEE